MNSKAFPINATEDEERAHLATVLGSVNAAIEAAHAKVRTRHEEMRALQQYLQQNKADMDHAEKASTRQSVNTMTTIGEQALSERQRLAKLIESPYFGRIDVARTDGSSVAPTYIGIHSLHDRETESQLIHDWRAPVSSMFYEFELGAAQYEAPLGRIECQILLKRQYRIEGRELKFMLDTSLTIQDDVLQEELSRTSDEKMRNIVATIQRDQNAIIRNDHAHTLIIQGAAGSGKTSIALHRIAFLLYTHKKSISSNDILIISPNKVFANYISQVLPELGESMVQETTMEDLAAELLDHKVRFQTFAEQVAVLVKGRDEAFAERVRFKATPKFLQELRLYTREAGGSGIHATDLRVGMFNVKAAWIELRFRMVAGRTANEQVSSVLEDIVDHMLVRYRKAVVGSDRTTLRAQLRKMVKTTTLKTLYKEFYAWLGRPDMLKAAPGGGYEYADVFPLIALAMWVEAPPAQSPFKHIVIDEMQDYTAVQYAVISELYGCRKTILGDANQAVSPMSASSADRIQEILPESQCMFMHMSYRSTVEINRVAQAIKPNPDIVPIERNGDIPTVTVFTTAEAERAGLRKAIEAFQESSHKSLAIICKTQVQADTLHEAIQATCPTVRLLNPESTVFSDGVNIVTAFLAKGLEFDRVLVPSCTERHYASAIDRHMLYVACTRAMHRLDLTTTGGPSSFLTAALDEGLVRRLDGDPSPLALKHRQKPSALRTKRKSR